VLASKVLAGRTPEVVRALRFKPRGTQKGLKPINIAGQTINPATDDFYQRLIIHRNAIKAKLETASAPVKPALKSGEQAIKILANATSYGIFVELNVGEYVKTERMVGYGGRPHPSRIKSQTSERPGAYFHPLLATLITGAARLMLALAEHQVVEQGLDWVFCDTDSLAIGNTRDLPPEEFVATALRVRDWFNDLNPYGEDNPILQLEKVNFPPDKRDDLRALDPPFCLTISAKRYVLFNRQNGSVVVRKASGHGLGHLMAPYMMNYPPRAASASNELACPFGKRTYGRKSFAQPSRISRTKPGEQPSMDASAGELGCGRPAISSRDDRIRLPVERDGGHRDDREGCERRLDICVVRIAGR
jgi:hypothetical protein